MTRGGYRLAMTLAPIAQAPRRLTFKAARISVCALAGAAALGGAGYVYGKPLLDGYIATVTAPKIAMAQAAGYAAGLKQGMALGRTRTITELQPIREREQAAARLQGRREMVPVALREIKQAQTIVRQQERVRVMKLQASRPQKCAESLGLILWRKEKLCS